MQYPAECRNLGERNVNIIVVNNSFAPHAKIQREWKEDTVNKSSTVALEKRVLQRTYYVLFAITVHAYMQ